MTRFEPLLALVAALLVAPTVLAQEHDHDHGRLLSDPYLESTTETQRTPAVHARGRDGRANVLPYQSGDPADWSPELDAVIAAPENHIILLENDYVRVLEVTLGPGELEPLHHHRWPSALHITAMGHFIDRNADGEVIFDTREMDGPLPLPLTMWKDAEAPHSVENLSSTETIRLIRVEVKQ